ncbi:peptidoglycan D,D-transpeptidase FtsI family protein [Actinomycetota bacterium]
MNSPIRRLSTLVALLFAALLVSSTAIQFFQAKDLNARSDNRRTLLSSYARERGQILVDGNPIAKSVPSDDELKWLRTYPQASLYSHVTGYYSFTYGAGGGLEAASDDLLSGQSDKLFYRRVSDMLTGNKPSGASVELTVNSAAQQAADEALGKQRGAAVALDPQTGAVLALVSNPAYDPGRLASHDAAKVAEAWKEMNAATSKPMVNRAIAGNLYPPGSTFKLVTAAAALSSGNYTQESEIPGPATLKLPQTTISLPNHGGGACGPGDKSTLIVALQKSCNTSFAWLGMQIGADSLRSQAAKFGFGDQLRIPMRVTPSTVPAELNQPQLAQSAIGQYDVRVTPLQMAMVAAGIANNGTVMEPYLVKSVQGSDASTIDETKPKELSQAVSPDVAGQLTRMMEAVVTSGTGKPARISGVSVAGKTGTAEHATGAAPHAWFVGFAPADDPKVAVAVVVEDGGSAGSEAFGGTVAGPIAKSVMEAVINQ